MVVFLKKLYRFIFATADFRVECYIKLIYVLKSKNYRILGNIFSRRLQRMYGVFLPYNADFDSSLILRHPVGIVIGENVKIGKNVIIFQNVTLGRSDTNVSSYPVIGDNTIIYSGAVVLGSINVGRDCIIGANAVVISDVPSGCVAVGVPAKYFPRRDMI